MPFRTARIRPSVGFSEVVSDNQTVTLQLAQRPCQHSLRNAVHTPPDLRMAQPTVDAERVDDAERPAVAGMRQQFAAHSVIIIPQPVADGLGSLLKIWFTVSRMYLFSFA